MKHLWLAPLLILSAAPAAAPAAAQGSTAQPAATPAPAPSRMGRWDEYRSRQEAMQRRDEMRDARRPLTGRVSPQQQVINEFAACLWRQEPSRARAALATPIGTSEERQALGLAASYDPCSDRPFISGRSGEFRGALAETGIHADAARKARIEGLAPVAPVRVPVARGRAFVASYAGCIAWADPAGSLALLGTPLGTPEEGTALRAMAVAMTGCMPEGAQYRVDVRDVRNHIADALYRMSEVAGA